MFKALTASLVVSFAIFFFAASFQVIQVNLTNMNQCKAQFIGQELGADEVSDRCKAVPTYTLGSLVKEALWASK